MAKGDEPPAVGRYDTFPEFRRLEGRLQELKKRREDLLGRANSIRGQLANPQLGREYLDRAAQRLLRGDSLPPDSPPPPSLEGLRDELRGLEAEEKTLGHALQVGEEELSRLQGKLGAQICDGVRAWHRGLGRKLLQAMQDVAGLASQERQLFARLDRENVPWGSFMPAFRPPHMGDLGDYHGGVAEWCAKLVEHGVVGAKDPALNGLGRGLPARPGHHRVAEDSAGHPRLQVPPVPGGGALQPVPLGQLPLHLLERKAA